MNEGAKVYIKSEDCEGTVEAVMHNRYFVKRDSDRKLGIYPSSDLEVVKTTELEQVA